MSRIYPHDRLLARTILPWIPVWVMPNHITILRLLLTPISVWLIYTEHYAIGIPFFVFTAFTDAVDGSLARIRNSITEWGMMWDPIADKILIVSTACVLILRHFPLALAVIILFLELVFLAGGYYWKRQGHVLSANIWGKMKMLFQVIGITLFLIFLVCGVSWLATLSYAVFVLATLFALASLFRRGL